MLNYLHSIFAILEKQYNLVVKNVGLEPDFLCHLLIVMTLARNSTSDFSSVFKKGGGGEDPVTPAHMEFSRAWAHREILRS